MSRRAVILSAVPVSTALCRYVQPGDFVVACDAGYRNAERLDLRPDLIVGDFDSAPQPKTEHDTIVLPHVKDDTDTQYAAHWLLEHGYDEITLLGALGGARLEHTLANLATGLFLAKNGVNVLLANERSEIRYLVPGRELILQRRDWKYLSVFPMEGRLTGVCIRGAFYPLENAVLTADYPLGVSNEFIADTAQLQCSRRLRYCCSDPRRCVTPQHCRHSMAYTNTESEVYAMHVVVVRCPRAFRWILRAAFKV